MRIACFALGCLTAATALICAIASGKAASESGGNIADLVNVLTVALISALLSIAFMIGTIGFRDGGSRRSQVGAPPAPPMGHPQQFGPQGPHTGQQQAVPPQHWPGQQQ